MTDDLIRQNDLDFMLWDWLKINDIFSQPRFSSFDKGTVGAVLEVSGQLAKKSFLTHYKKSDSNEPWMDGDGNVHVLPEIGDALREFAELGLFGAGFEERFGGMNLPKVVESASILQFSAANMATTIYTMLTVANARVIVNFGTQAQVETFAAPQLSGNALGTMCLSEPHAGSALADVRTRAESEGEDSLGKRFRITGNKMWISGGDQDISENIIHLVLAKIPDADGNLPPGTKGISLFIVPKFLPNIRERNDISVAGLNHKMGSRGTSNCLLNFGEGQFQPHGASGAIGYLVGEAGEGLAMMFQMMNETRINVGVCGAALAYRGYRLSVQYATERMQGRALDQSAPKGGGNVAIIRHPDVQKMLLAEKCYAEGAVALALYCSFLVDCEAVDPNASKLLAILTPVVKTWPSEWGVAANDLAIQIHGGYGYTRDFDVEQLYRDNRLNPIHEGTTGIQALDLLGRKILYASDDSLAVFGGKIEATATRASSTPELATFGATLTHAWAKVLETVEIAQCAEPHKALAHATSFLSAFGHIVIAWLWLEIALVCKTTNVDQEESFLLGKLRACRFFYEMELPKVVHWLDIVASLNDTASDVPIEQF